jgi:hypothetical protein
MISKVEVIAEIYAKFGQGDYPGDPFLQGSFEGCEPFEEVEPFKGKTDWKQIDAVLLDAHASALSFFSEGAFRFFLPAYLVADLEGKLDTADPLFHLTHGFSEVQMQISAGDKVIEIKPDKTALVNPRRYGAMTFYDSARHRLSVFTREEAQAIVLYLQYKRESGGLVDFVNEMIESALNSFWLERARSAPTQADLKQYLKEQRDFIN